MSLVWLAVIWLVATIIFVIVDLFADRYVLPLALGAGVAAIASLVQISWQVQLIVFVVVSVVGYVFIRPHKDEGRKKRDRQSDDDGF